MAHPESRANHNTFTARAAIREAVKVIGLTEQKNRQVTDKIGFSWRLKNIWNEIIRRPIMRGIEFQKPCMVVVPGGIRRY